MSSMKAQANDLVLNVRQAIALILFVALSPGYANGFGFFFDEDSRYVCIAAEVNADRNEVNFARFVVLNQDGSPLEYLTARKAIYVDESKSWRLESGSREMLDHETGDVDMRVAFDVYEFNEVVAEPFLLFKEEIDNVVRIPDGIFFYEEKEDDTYKNIFLFSLPDRGRGQFVQAREMSFSEDSGRNIVFLKNVNRYVQSRERFGEREAGVTMEEQRKVLRSNEMIAVKEALNR